MYTKTVKMKGNQEMTQSNAVKDMYLPFLRECWRNRISDSLIATIIPMDNSTISKIRKEEKYLPSNSTVKKETVDILFEIVAKFPWILNYSNPCRTASNVKFWKRHEKLFQYFMEIRNNLKADIQAAEFDEEQRAVELTASQTDTYNADTCPSSIYEGNPEPNFVVKTEATKDTEDTELCRRTAIKMQLRDVVHRAVEYDMYDLAEDLIRVLAEHF